MSLHHGTLRRNLPALPRVNRGRPPDLTRSISELTATARSVLRRAHDVQRYVTSPARVMPTFLIIGGQRCGSTSLFSYLARHPAVGRSRGKEVHFFTLEYERGLAWYRSHFPTRLTVASTRRRLGVDMIAGEATPYYLFHPLAPYRVQAVLPEARLIAVLRDPVDRAYSHYQHEVALGVETLGFAEAVEAESDRLDGEEDRIEQDPRYVSF